MSAKREKPDTVERQVGNCQVCEGDFKLRAGRLVHHGFERPGVGFIIGDCPGVNEVPYEVSCDLVKTHLGAVEKFREGLQRRLRQLEENAVEQLPVKEWRPGARAMEIREGQVAIRPDPTSERDSFVVTYARSGTEPSLWRSMLRDEIRSVKYDVARAESEVEHLRERIAKWHSRPIRSVEEIAEKKRAAQAGRAAARAEKQAKLAAKEAEKLDKARQKMSRYEPEIAALKDTLKELARKHGRETDPRQQREIEYSAARATDVFVGVSWGGKKSLLGSQMKATFLKLLQLDEELVALKLARKYRSPSGAFFYSFD